MQDPANRYLIRTVSGRYVDLSKPSPEVVSLGDMAHSLAQINRFQGHTLSPITVLEHLIHTAQRAAQLTDDWQIQYAALMHDAHEAYVCDVPTPLKALLGESYARIEDGWQEAVFDWAGLPVELADHPIVKQADREMLLAEARKFHGVTEGELKAYWPEGDVPEVDWRVHDPILLFQDTVAGYRLRKPRLAGDKQIEYLDIDYRDPVSTRSL